MTRSFFARPLLLLATILSTLSHATPVQALMVNVDGYYELFSMSTSYVSNPDLFSARPSGPMPWWGNAALASRFAAEAFDQLGLDLYTTGYGAIFAYSYDSAGLGTVNGIVQNTADINDQLDLDATDPLAASVLLPYAYVRTISSVPAPLPLFGAAAAFGWARRIRNVRCAARLKQIEIH